MYSSENSEDEEAKDQEIQLYTELYFGKCSTPFNEKERGPAENPLFDKQEPALITRPTGTIESELMNIRKNATDFHVNHLPSLLTNNGKESEFVSNPNSQNTTVTSVRKENVTDCTERRDGTEKNAKGAKLKKGKKKLRKRNLSQCSSVDSISGREPLDSLYCNISAENSLLIPIQEISFDSNYDSLNTTVQEATSNEKILDETSKYSIGSNTIQNIDSCLASTTYQSSDSDKELCILPPPPPKKIETVTVVQESNSDSNSIEVIKAISSTKKLKPKAKLSLKKKKNLIINLLSNSSSSDEFDWPVSKPLVLNIESSRSKFSPKSRNLRLSKSLVIFSKARLPTKKNPSCPTWTQEMASFYDSDISDDYSVTDVHQSMSDSAKNWKICDEDYPFRKSRRNPRYYEKRCTRCKEFGHLLNQCPRVPHCLYCGSDKHVKTFQCPFNCCLKCGKAPHGFCYSTSIQRVCEECGNSGHQSFLCPDLWRRFHNTTSGDVPIPPDLNTNQRRNPSCYNCGKRGHYGHECLSKNVKKYALDSTAVFSYDPVDKTNLQMTSIQVPHYPAVNPNQGETEVRKVMSLSHRNLKKVVGRKKYVLEEIQDRSQVALQPFFSGMNNNKLTMLGTDSAIQVASDLVSMVLKKTPKKEFTELMSCVKRRDKTLSEKSKDASFATPSKVICLDSDDSSSPISQCLFPPSSSADVPLASLKVPLPSNPKSAVKALNKILKKRKWENSQLRQDQLNDLITFFQTEGKSSARATYKKKVNALSFLLHSQSMQGEAKRRTNNLRFYRTQIQSCKAKRLDPDLHKEVSREYLKVASPSFKVLPSLLAMARMELKALRHTSPKLNNSSDFIPLPMKSKNKNSKKKKKKLK